MTFVGAGIGLGQPSTGLRFATTRGRIQGSPIMGVNYPSPFFDIAHTYLPTTVKQMLRWCRYYFMTHPLIHAVVFKLSEYPMTDIVVDHESPDIKQQWEEYLQDHLCYRAFRIEVGLDKNCYGNAFVSLSYPFVKYLTCRACGAQDQAKKIRDRWVFTNYQFRLTCPKCGMVGEAAVKDWYVKDPSGIRLVRWNPEDIEISYNDITGNYTYFYTIPGPLRSDIVVGKKDVVEQVPQIFIQALRQQKGVVFNKEAIFHLKRPTLANQDRGWGIPLLLPVLKDAFYLQIMKKAQEALLVEHIVPLRVLFPQAGSGSSDPFTTINLDTWRDHVAQEIARWRYDCVAPATLVETSIGLRRADEVGEGTLLKNHLGKWAAVEKVWRRPLRGGERAFQLVARGLHGALGVVSEGHPFYAARRVGNGLERTLTEPRFVRVKDLRVGDYVGYPVVYTQERQEALDKQVFDGELAWILGLYAAEGDVTPRGVFFSFSSRETEFEGRLCRFFSTRFGAQPSSIERSENAIRVGFDCAPAAEFFQKFCPGDVTTRHFAPVLLTCEDRLAAQMVRGFLDGVGWYRDPDSSQRIFAVSSCRQLIADIRQLVLVAGIIPALTRINELEGDIWALTFQGESRDRLLAWFAAKALPPMTDCRIGLFRDGYAWHRIEEIRQVAVDEVIGFQLDRREGSVALEDDTEAHGTFCLWGAASANTNYIPIMPLPIGQETIGGDGRALLLTQEMQLHSEQMINGMLCPREFIVGGLSYAGSSVSMRMLENSFLGDILEHKRLLRFIIQNVASYLSWPVVRGRFKPFKMADDLQRTALLFQANQAQKVSDTTFLSQLDLSQEEEDKIMLRETASRLEATERQQLAMADIQGKAQLVMMKYQTKAQLAAQVAAQQPAAPGEPGGVDSLQEGTPGGQGAAAPGEGAPPGLEGTAGSVPEQAQSPLSLANRSAAPQMDVQSWAMAQARLLASLPPAQQEMALQNLRAQSPELADIVRTLLRQTTEEPQQGEAPTDMRPLPDKLPPRRAAQIV